MSRFKSLCPFVLWLGCLVVVVCGGNVVASPQWRGTQRDGHVDGSQLPTEWPKTLRKAWSISVGEGHATPVIFKERIFLHTRQGADEIVRALELTRGRELWQQHYPAPYEVNSAAIEHGPGPKSTPVLSADGKILITQGISGILSAWNTDSGKRLWQHTFTKDFPKTSPLFGTAASPVIYESLCIAAVGGHDNGALSAFDLTTGRLVWTYTATGPSYASPVLRKIGEKTVIYTQTQQACVALQADTGDVQWTLPFTTGYDQNSVTPVVAGDLVIWGGFQEPTFAVRDTGMGQPVKVWENARIPLYMSSPVVVGESLYGFTQKDKGQLFCADLLTGQIKWTGPGRQGDNGALLVTGQTGLVLSTTGELLVVQLHPAKLDIVARYQLAETPTWAHPVIAGSQILVKDRTHLIAWETAR